jgi:AraC-like DNA-binding protein
MSITAVTFMQEAAISLREDLDNYLLIFTVSGNGIIRYRGQEQLVRQNQAFVVNCSEYHHYKTGPEGSWEIKWVHFNGSACESYFELINEDSFNIISLTDLSEVESYLDKIPDVIVESENFYDVKLSAIMTQILSELVLYKRNPVNNRKFSEYNQMISKVTTYMQKNYAQKVGNSDLIKIAHLSEYHFLRLFKKCMGISPYEYLTNYRINKSKSLLKQTAKSINEIAYSVGFNNANNFIREFKILVGTTPLKYRNYWIT